MSPLRLFGTPLSHFTRKVRILLEELGIDYEFVRATSVLATAPAAYGENPLMRVPTLVHGEVTMIESDHIARYLVARFDPGDKLGVTSTRPDDLNRLAVANGVMANEVVLILAQRGGLVQVDQVAYFRKLASAIDAGLAWLDARLPAATGAAFDYGDVGLVCMWQHLLHYQLPMLEPLERYPRVAERVAQLAGLDVFARTAPAASLAEAVAAGWSPAAPTNS